MIILYDLRIYVLIDKIESEYFSIINMKSTIYKIVDAKNENINGKIKKSVAFLSLMLLENIYWGRMRFARTVCEKNICGKNVGANRIHPLNWIKILNNKNKENKL